MSYETFIGLRYLKSRRKSTFVSVISFISILGVMLGVATLCVTLAVMNGFQEELQNKVLGANAHGVLYKYGAPFYDHESVRSQLLSADGVKSISPIIIGQVMLTSGNRTVGAGMKGVHLGHIEHLKPIIRSLKNTKNLDLLAQSNKNVLPGIAIGKALARRLRVKKGDVIKMVSPLAMFGFQRKTRTSHMNFQVRYIYKFGMYQYDSKFCFIDLVQSQKFLGLEGAASGLEILAKDIYKIEGIRKFVRSQLGGWPYRLRDWRQMNRNLFKAIQQNKMALGIILLFIILVASMNIAGTLIMMLIEKSKDVAILRTMGADRQSIMKIFITYGLYIGALGTMIGLTVGVSLCYIVDKIGINLDADVYFISHLSLKIIPSELLIIAIASIAISFLATLYPAIQASRQKPVEVLRYE